MNYELFFKFKNVKVYNNFMFVFFSDVTSGTVLTGYSVWLEASVVAVLFTICIVVVLIGCLDCCRNNRFSFKVNY